MNFPNYFADANSDFDEADFVIYGVPYDQTSSFRRGADKAPKEIRLASWNFETYDIRTGADLRDVRFHDYGDLDVKNDSPKEMVEKVKKFTNMLLGKNKFPISIGGEHSITSGIIQAFPKDVAVLSLDAHLDFRNEYENERFNHACVTRRIADHVDIKNIVVFGFRSAEKEELEDAKKKDLLCFDSFTIGEVGIQKALNETKKHFGNKPVYLTLDIDVVDPAYAPGTSTPELFGLTPLDILTCIDFFSPYIIGFDIVEVCPPYDKGETSLLAAKLLRYSLGIISKKKCL
jgi:agmatinase